MFLDEKMCYILVIKCMNQILSSTKYDHEILTFEILTELYKFFKSHPPENLVVINNKVLKINI